jgi:hypothetical protein
LNLVSLLKLLSFAETKPLFEGILILIITYVR